MFINIQMIWLCSLIKMLVKTFNILTSASNLISLPSCDFILEIWVFTLSLFNWAKQRRKLSLPGDNGICSPEWYHLSAPLQPLGKNCERVRGGTEDPDLASAAARHTRAGLSIVFNISYWPACAAIKGDAWRIAPSRWALTCALIACLTLFLATVAGKLWSVLAYICAEFFKKYLLYWTWH